MKQLVVMLCVLLAFVAVGCGTYPKTAEERPYYTKSEVDAKLDSLMQIETASHLALKQVVDSLGGVLSEHELRFLEYRRNIMSNDIPEYVDFCEERVPIEIPDVKERLYKEILFMSENQAQLVIYYLRMRNYFPIIEPMLADSSMPDDLKWICVIESGLKPKATSISNAKGWWQFIASTGKKFDLDQTDYKDMRMNLIESTNGAIKYFDTLYALFDDWALACAAYNMGDGALNRAMEDQGVNDYYHLWLPKETEAYLFRAIAAKLILSNPGSYGIMPEKFTEWELQESDTITVTVQKQLSARFVADACKSTYRQIRLLNPELIKSSWPPGKHRITVPVGTRDLLVQALADLRSKKKK